MQDKPSSPGKFAHGKLAAPEWVDRNGPLLVLTLAIATCSFVAYKRFQITNDDAFITFAYAKNLATGKGFVFNPGERVLGTTTPLLTMILAALNVVTGIAVPELAKLVAIACLGASAFVLDRLLANERLRYVGACLTPPIFFNRSVHWATGNETPLLFLTISGAILLYRRGRLDLALVAGVLAYLARGEGVLVIFVILAHYLWTHRSIPRITVFLPAALILVSWHAFTLVYFQAILPNTFQTKTLEWHGPTFLQSLPAFVYRISVVDQQGVIFGFLLTLGLILLILEEPLICMYVLLHLLGYSFLRAASHSWYYHSVGYLWALSLGVGTAWLVQNVASKRLRPLAPLVAGGCTVVLFAAGPLLHLPHQDDLPRFQCYQRVVGYLRGYLKPSDAVISQEIGIIGFSLDQRVLDPDFLVHRRPPAVPASRRILYLFEKYRPQFFVTTSCLSAEEMPVKEMNYTGGEGPICYTLANYVTVPNYHACVYRSTDCPGK